MHWILEKIPNRFNLTRQDFSQIKLSEILAKKNLSFSFHKIIPFSGEFLPPFEEEGKAICIGPYSMRNYAKANNIQPGVYDIEAMDFLVQKQMWGEKMLNFESKVIPFKELNAIKLEPNSQYFMRPIKDSKVFAGGIFTTQEILDWHKKVVVLEEDYGDTLNGSTLVQILKPLQIEREYRNWVVDGKVVTSSLYKIKDKVTYSAYVPQDIIDYAQECVNIWKPHKAFVIDICEITTEKNTKEFRIVEINTLNAAGFYEADLDKLIDALEKMENK